MRMTVSFTLRFDKPTRAILNELAKRERRKPGDYLRLLVVREADRLHLAGGSGIIKPPAEPAPPEVSDVHVPA